MILRAPFHSLTLAEISANSLRDNSFPPRLLQPAWLHGTLVSLFHIPGAKKLVVPAYKLVTLMNGLKKISADGATTSIVSAYATRFWLPEKAPEWVKRLSHQSKSHASRFDSTDQLNFKLVMRFIFCSYVA